MRFPRLVRSCGFLVVLLIGLGQLPAAIGPNVEAYAIPDATAFQPAPPSAEPAAESFSQPDPGYGAPAPASAMRVYVYVHVTAFARAWIYVYVGMEDPVNRWDPTGLDDVRFAPDGSVFWEIWYVDENGQPELGIDGKPEVYKSVKIGTLDRTGNQVLGLNGKRLVWKTGIEGFVRRFQSWSAHRSAVKRIGGTDGDFNRRFITEDAKTQAYRKEVQDKLTATVPDNQLMDPVFKISSLLAADRGTLLKEISGPGTGVDYHYYPVVKALEGAVHKQVVFYGTDRLDDAYGHLKGGSPECSREVDSYMAVYFELREMAEMGYIAEGMTFGSHGAATGGVSLNRHIIAGEDNWKWFGVVIEGMLKTNAKVAFMGCDTGTGAEGSLAAFLDSIGQDKSLYATFNGRLQVGYRGKGRAATWERSPKSPKFEIRKATHGEDGVVWEPVLPENSGDSLWTLP